MQSTLIFFRPVNWFGTVSRTLEVAIGLDVHGVQIVLEIDGNCQRTCFQRDAWREKNRLVTEYLLPPTAKLNLDASIRHARDAQRPLTAAILKWLYTARGVKDSMADSELRVAKPADLLSTVVASRSLVRLAP